MYETGSGTNNVGADVQNIHKRRRSKRNSAHLEYAEFLLKFPRKKLKNETKARNQTKRSMNKTKRSRKRRARSEAERSKIEEAKMFRSEARRLRKYLLKGTEMAQKINVANNPTQLGQIDNSLETENVLNTPPDEGNCYSILTRSRTAVSKHSKLKIKPVISHDVQPKVDLKINQEGQTSQSNTFPAIAIPSAFSHPPQKQEEKSEEFQLKFLGETTLNYLAENRSLCTPYIVKKIARAHAHLKWDVIYGVLKRCLTDKYINLDKNDASGTWGLNEDDGDLLHSFFPMPYVGDPSSVGLVYMNEECVHSPKLLPANSEPAQSSDHHVSPVIAGENLAHVSSSPELFPANSEAAQSSDHHISPVIAGENLAHVSSSPELFPANSEAAQSSDHHVSPVIAGENLVPVNSSTLKRAYPFEKSSEKTTIRLELNSPGTLGVQEIPTPAKVNRNSNIDNHPINHGCFYNHGNTMADALCTYKGVSSINSSIGGPVITTDCSKQVSIHNNQEAFQSALEADTDKRNQEAFQSALEADTDKRNQEAFQSALEADTDKRNQEAFQSALEADTDKRNKDAFQSALEADTDKHLAVIKPKELMFLRKTSSLFGEMKLTRIRLLDVKWKLKKHTLEIDKAYKIMTSVYSEIEQFSHLIIKFKSEQNMNGFCKMVPPNLKVLHPSEIFKSFNEIQSCLGTLKQLYTQIERTLITNAANNNTSSDLFCDSSRTNDSATALPSSATEPALNLSQQSLSDDHLASASEQVPEISSVRFLPTFESKPPREKKYRTNWCKDPPIHVMSENEALHWSRLQKLYKEIRNKTSCVRKCIRKLHMAKEFTKFESGANSGAFLIRLHQKVSEYQAKITAENNENIHFCYASVQAVPGKLITKRQRSCFVYGLDQVWAAFNKYKALFQRLIDRFGYKHAIG